MHEVRSVTEFELSKCFLGLEWSTFTIIGADKGARFELE
jgi:hypothetical protein